MVESANGLREKFNKMFGPNVPPANPASESGESLTSDESLRGKRLSNPEEEALDQLEYKNSADDGSSGDQIKKAIRLGIISRLEGMTGVAMQMRSKMKKPSS